MKFSSAACLLLLLRNAAGSNIRGSRALRPKEQEESANLIEEVSTQDGTAIGLDEQVYVDEESGAGDAVQANVSEPTSGSIQEASSIGIDEQVYEDDAPGAGDAVQEDLPDPMLGNPEEVNTFSNEEPVYAYDAFGAGDAIQEPIDYYAYNASVAGDYVEEPIDQQFYAYNASGAVDYAEEPIEESFYAYNASGAGDYVQGNFLGPMPENVYEASTYGINEPSYSYDALGNYVQGDLLEPMPQEASSFGISETNYGYDALGNYVQGDLVEPMPQEASTSGIDERVYSYDALGNYVQGDLVEPMPQEASTSGIDERVYSYDALGNYVQGDLVEPMPQEASTFGMDARAYSYDALGNYVQGDLVEPMPQEASTFGMDERDYSYDALGNYVQGDSVEPMPGNTQEVSSIGINDEVYGYDASGAGAYGQGDVSGQESKETHHRALQTTRWKTLNYLYSIRGRGTVAGMHERQSETPSRFTEQVRQVSGKYPGLWSGDFLFDYNRRFRQNMIDEAKRRWNAGTMINIMYHSCNPATANVGEECNWDDRFKGPQSRMSDSDWQAIITDGSGLNRKWKQYLDEISVYLQDLKNNGVEVLFRPFHEMNQGVFWWGGRPGASGTRRLYQISHDYLTNVKRLDNLIWVWNIQDFGSLSNDAQNYNPGSNYYEVASLDVYEGFQTWKYDVMRNVAGGKPIAIGECDVLPDASRLVSEPLWTFFMSWSELTFDKNSGDKIRSVYNQAITRDEMGAWQSGVIPPPTPTPPPNTTGSLGDWERCSSNSQCRNGCCSGMYSGGVLKCTPLSGGFNSAICTATGGSGGSTITVQAESYSNSFGVVPENTSDVGGGRNVGNLNTGDWMSYPAVTIPTTGTYTVSYRVAGFGGSLQLERAGGTPVFGTVVIPWTGGWQNWQTVSHTVNLSAGSLPLGIKVTGGGWNINWFTITKA